MTANLLEQRDKQHSDEFTSLFDGEDGPMGFEAGDANLYRYVGNSPLNGTDPSGLWRWFGWFRTPEDPGPDERNSKAHEWCEQMKGTAIDGGIEVAVEVTEKGVALPVGTACDAMEAARKATAVAAMRAAEKRYNDAQRDKKGERVVRKRFEEWQETKKKYHEIQRAER